MHKKEEQSGMVSVIYNHFIKKKPMSNRHCISF